MRYGFLVALFFSLTLAEELPENKENLEKNPEKSTLLEKIVEKEKEHSVPRETIPVEEINFLIKTPVPKTAHYLPFLQPLFNITPGTLPNPIGVSLIGSYTSEQYTITRFKGTLGPNLGMNVVNGLLGFLNQQTINGIIDGTIKELYPLVKRDKEKIIQAIDNNQQLTQKDKTFLKGAINALTNPIVGPFALEALKKYIKNQANAAIKDPAFINKIATLINQTTGAGKQKEWKLSEGKVRTKTSAIGLKADVWILPFMNLFATATYLNMEQHTSIGSATLPLDRPIGGLNSITFPIGNLENKLSGYAVMGGTNIAIGYKGFFASFMVSGGYVQLDDTQNNIKGFVEKPFMYLAPRIGYSYNGIFTIHTGLQRIELFGATEGKDLSKLTNGLVSNYSVEITKFPVTFVAGLQFMFMRDLGLSVEYVGSPDTNGLNAELAFRF